MHRSSNRFPVTRLQVPGLRLGVVLLSPASGKDWVPGSYVGEGPGLVGDGEGGVGLGDGDVGLGDGDVGLGDGEGDVGLGDGDGEVGLGLGDGDVGVGDGDGEVGEGEAEGEGEVGTGWRGCGSRGGTGAAFPGWGRVISGTTGERLSPCLTGRGGSAAGFVLAAPAALAGARGQRLRSGPPTEGKTSLPRSTRPT